LSNIAAENDLRDHRHWISRLFLSSLIVFATLSLAMQLPVSEALGSKQSHGQVSLTTTAGAAPFLVGKSSQTTQPARKQIAKDSGPDKVPKILTVGNHPVFFDEEGAVRRHGLSGYSPEHILFRSGSRGISPRAPPMHFSG
jgi:hypothetical protein